MYIKLQVLSIKRKFKKCAGGCGLERVLFSHGQCRSCWLRNNPPKKKVPNKKIKPVSQTGIQRSLDYKKAREEFMETHDVCQVNLPGCLVPYPVEDKSVLECHHMAGRLGSYLTDKDYFLCVCNSCHRWITDHSKEAIENGWSVSRNRERNSK